MLFFWLVFFSAKSYPEDKFLEKLLPTFRTMALAQFLRFPPLFAYWKILEKMDDQGFLWGLGTDEETPNVGIVPSSSLGCQ